MKNLKRIYIDTSVVGGIFDDEFAEHSSLFFEEVINKRFRIITSDTLARELKLAPSHVSDILTQIPSESIEKVYESREAKNLANQYIKANVVGPTSYTDCLHIAIATIAVSDILVSWNFKHIVNIDRIVGYNSVNLAQGYRTLEIRTPREILTL